MLIKVAISAPPAIAAANNNRRGCRIAGQDTIATPTATAAKPAREWLAITAIQHSTSASTQKYSEPDKGAEPRLESLAAAITAPVPAKRQKVFLFENGNTASPGCRNWPGDAWIGSISERRDTAAKPATATKMSFSSASCGRTFAEICPSRNRPGIAARYRPDRNDAIGSAAARANTMDDCSAPARAGETSTIGHGSDWKKWTAVAESQQTNAAFSAVCRCVFDAAATIKPTAPAMT